MSTIEQYIDKVEAWLYKRRFVLLKSKFPTIEDEVDFERKVVFLSLKSKPENQLYSLLHECGHIIIRSRKDYAERYKSSIAFSEGKLNKETYRASIEEIEEEILAWREGYALASKLEIPIKENIYYRYSSRWVMTYIVKASIGNEYLYLGTSSDKETGADNSKTVEETKNENPNDIAQEESLDKDQDPCYNNP